MAKYPYATWNPAGTTPGGPIVPRVVINHVTAGRGNARPHDNLEWHFEISLKGEVEQQVDTGLRADANYKANTFAISIEHEGLGDGVFTDAQLDANVALSEWLMAQHPDIKRQRCDRWDGSGFGYHVMWGAPGPWTPVAKSCPGPKRIKQFEEVLLPRILNPYPNNPDQPVQEDEIMLYLFTADDPKNPNDDATWFVTNGGSWKLPLGPNEPDAYIKAGAVKKNTDGSWVTVVSRALLDKIPTVRQIPTN